MSDSIDYEKEILDIVKINEIYINKLKEFFHTSYIKNKNFKNFKRIINYCIESKKIYFLNYIFNYYNIDLTNYNYPKPILYMAIYKKKYDILEYLINQKLLNPNIRYNYIDKGYKKYFSNAFSFNEYCNSHMNDFIKINNILNRYK